MSYPALLARARETALLSSIGSLLSWDQETQMPPAGAAYRAEQAAYIAGQAHRLFTDAETGRLLEACEQETFAEGSPEAVNIREWRWAYDREKKLSSALVEEFERTRSQAHEAWVEAREKSEFPVFAPFLQKLLDLSRQKADLWGYTDTPYDALLEGYERGAKTSEIEKLFAALAPEASRLVREAKTNEARLPAGPYPEERQKLFNHEVAEAIGFDFNAGRIDTAVHPFCTEIGPRDCRLTTRYDENDFTGSLYGILHEAGHGLYDQGLPQEHYGTPRGSFVSLGIHESQSRLWENHVGRSLEFWQAWLPRAIELFPQLKSMTPESMLAYTTKVERSYIRVEADEVTYDLHIILRFELEKALLEGKLKVTDLPQAWNARFEELMGLKVKKDSEGCLQDIHWSMGGFGYFPTYTLGNLNAAQLMEAARKASPGLDQELGKKNYAPLLTWLRKEVHGPGTSLMPNALMQQATGSNPSQTAYLQHLRKRV